MKKLISFLLLVPIVITLSACGLFKEIHTFELFDYQNPTDVYADVHGDHWDGSLPTLRLNETLTLGATVKPSRTNQIDFNEDTNRFEAHVNEGSRDDVVTIENHGNRVTFIPEAEGITEIIFTVYEDNEVLYESPAIYLMIYGTADEAGRVMNVFELLDVSRDYLEVGYVHIDHWHGGVPAMSVGDELLLTAFIVDEHDQELDLSGDYHLEATFVQGSNTSVISIDNRGSGEILLEASSVGQTQIMFRVYLDGELHYQTPPTNVSVSE